MIHPLKAKDGTRKPAKRMLATGRKINGVWEVRTFLRGVAGGSGGAAFWELGSDEPVRRRPR